MHTHIISKNIIVTTLIMVLLALFGSTFPMNAEAKDVIRAKVDATCMQTAVDTREAAIATSFTTFNTDIMAALTARKTALHDAWGLGTSTRATAIKSAWTDWKNAHKEAFTDLKSARKSAWTTFKETVRTTCKTTLPKEENLVKDASGSVSL